MASTCGADSVANDLLASLLGGKSFDLPPVDLNDDAYKLPDGSGDLYGPIDRPTNEDLTERKVGGAGTFDAMLAGVAAHLAEQFEKNRITGDQYAKVFSEVTATAMQTAVQFLLGREQSHWQAVAAQLGARRAEIETVTARIQLAAAKAQLQAAHYQALTAEAQYGLTKMQIAVEDAKYCNLLVQKKLLEEQIESARAQTTNTRSDGSPVAGQVGKQIELYDQQIESYQRDAEVKGAKVYTDAWMAMKTIDEGLDPPDNFHNVRINEVLNKIASSHFGMAPIAETSPGN